jgi:hypothetical protein
MKSEVDLQFEYEIHWNQDLLVVNVRFVDELHQLLVVVDQEKLRWMMDSKEI